MALRIERIGSRVIELVQAADEAFERGESILQEQHSKGTPWDRFGTMLARHRATHEAMNGAITMATTTAARGLWRALRAEREGTPEQHKSFVIKQLGMNAAAGVLAVSKPLGRVPKISAKRHQLAAKLLG